MPAGERLRQLMQLDGLDTTTRPALTGQMKQSHLEALMAHPSMVYGEMSVAGLDASLYAWVNEAHTVLVVDPPNDAERRTVHLWREDGCGGALRPVERAVWAQTFKEIGVQLRPCQLAIEARWELLRRFR